MHIVSTFDCQYVCDKKHMSQAASMQQLMFSNIRDWQESGLTQKAWCQAHQIKYHIFHYWYKVYRNKGNRAASAFVKLDLPPAAGYGTPHSELILPDGKRFLFHQPLCIDYLKALIG